jgi:hypothetical protein
VPSARPFGQMSEQLFDAQSLIAILELLTVAEAFNRARRRNEGSVFIKKTIDKSSGRTLSFGPIEI